MIIEYDEEDRCIRVDEEAITPAEAWGDNSRVGGSNQPT